MYVWTDKGLGWDVPRIKSQSDIIKDLERKFTFPFWKLPEGKNYQEFADGSFRFEVNGVTIHMFPDELLTEEEYQKKGGSFKHDSRLVTGNTRWGWKKTNFDTKSVQYQRVNGSFMVTDYKEPTFEIYIQTFYRKGNGIYTLAKARSLSSGYGKGKTLREHESWHAADGIDYIKKLRPSLPDMRGSSSDDFNNALSSYYNRLRILARR